MFNQLVKLGLGHASVFKRGKISPSQALKNLEKFFRNDLADIYKEIGEFREGLHSLEVFMEQ